MKPWKKRGLYDPPEVVKEIERDPVAPEPPAPVVSRMINLFCVFGPHEAEVMHRGTAYCRSCYDERNRLGTLVN